jgi:hypothetical protein
MRALPILVSDVENSWYYDPLLDGSTPDEEDGKDEEHGTSIRSRKRQEPTPFEISPTQIFSKGNSARPYQGV